MERGKMVGALVEVAAMCERSNNKITKTLNQQLVTPLIGSALRQNLSNFITNIGGQNS